MLAQHTHTHTHTHTRVLYTHAVHKRVYCDSLFLDMSAETHTYIDLKHFHPCYQDGRQFRQQLKTFLFHQANGPRTLFFRGSSVQYIVSQNDPVLYVE